MQTVRAREKGESEWNSCQNTPCSFIKFKHHKLLFVHIDICASISLTKNTGWKHKYNSIVMNSTIKRDQTGSGGYTSIPSMSVGDVTTVTLPWGFGLFLFRSHQCT